ncbi:MMPL family transporter [Nocardia sp. NPDC055321]
MSGLLRRLGDVAYRRRRLVTTIWIAVLIALVGAVGIVGDRLNDQFTVPGTESQRALDVLADTAPESAGANAQFVFTAPDGHVITEPAYVTAIQQVLDRAGTAPNAIGVVTPQQTGAISQDRTTAVGIVSLADDPPLVSEDTRRALTDSAEPARAAGLEVAVGGTAFSLHELKPGIAEVLGLVVAMAVLLITFGSLLAAGMPLLSALFGIGVTVAGLFAVTSVTSVSSTALTLAVMLGLAVGIDYALFILTRHRAQLAAGMTPRESVSQANATAGSAVVFAGTTVIIALAALSVIGIPFLTVMGLAASGAVLVAVAVAVTLLPALAGFAGTRLAPRSGSRAHRRATATDADGGARTMGARWITLVTKRPVITIALVTAILGLLAVPAASIQMSLPDNGFAARGTGERVAYDTIADKFGPGLNGPLLVVVDAPAGDTRTAQQVAAAVQRLPGVALIAPPQPTSAAGQSIVTVFPETAPEDQRTADLVTAIRDEVPAQIPGGDIAVTGYTAVSIDVSQRFAASLLPFLGIVVGLSLILLVLVFRSIAVPIKATVTFLLSLAATLGTTVAVFQWGWAADLFGIARTGPIVSFLPIMVMGVLFGLAMDYQVFLVSGIREEWSRTGDAQRSITEGARHNVRVVTAAATIMVVVFASFVPIEDAQVKAIAFALAVGVLIDAFAIRLTLVPAVLALLGHRAWWLPRSLDRILPNLNIEGTHEENAHNPEGETSDRRDREVVHASSAT